ncbi:hypothetical protein K1719_034401 [Acacia pycnantha]|nr:hypothetical protein K1719_034401 [Acacia pycnantha]
MEELMAEVQRSGAELGFWEMVSLKLLIQCLAVVEVVILAEASIASASLEVAQPWPWPAAIFRVRASGLSFCFSFKSFHYLLTVFKLALSSAAMVCLEYWAFEVLVFLAGLLPDSEITTSLIAICVSTEVIGYMFAYGLGAAASTRIANELGADRPERAKHAMGVALKLSILFSFCIVVPLLLGHGIWIQLFSSNSVIKQEFASMAPLLAISILLDCVQGILSAVARGCGWQHLAVYVNLATFYLIGLPISCLLGFKFKLHAQGLWIGLICGLACQTGTLLILTKKVKWTKLSV